jgi:hypothetical protein
MAIRHLKPVYYSILFLTLICGTGIAQTHENSPGLFDSDDVLTVRLSGNIRELMKDKSDDMQYHPLTLSYLNADSTSVSIPLKVKTRGNFRRTQGNCTYPPLMLNFADENTPKSSLFNNQDKLKLVTPCSGDKYVVREYLVYKLYNLISPKSFRARLVKVIYDDTVKGKASEPLYGIILEEESRMAKRNNMAIVKERMIKPEQTQLEDFLNMAVFEYMIGNTDWSIQYYQNVKLIANDSLSVPYTVPYDFDHAGIVAAPYAKPAEALQLSSTQERRYRGFCITSMTGYDKTFELFNSLKEEFYAVYTKSSLLEASYIKATVKFLDDFYKTINDIKAAKTAFSYPCNPEGTGNVVIKGLGKK